MANKRTNKQHLEYIFVPTGDQALAAGTLSTAGNAVNLTNGQLGVKVATHDSLSAALEYGDFLAAGDVAADADAVTLVMGTPYSADTTAVRGWDIREGFQESGIIRANQVRTYSARLCDTPTYSAQLFNGFNASTPDDESVYKIYIESRSVRKDRDYGRALDSVPFTFVTPDYALLPAIVDPLDHLLQNLLHRVNLASKGINTSPSYMSRGNSSFIGFGLNIAGGGGQAVGTVTCGTSITVMTTTVGATTTNSVFVADEAFVQTLADWIAAGTVTAATTIETINITTAGTAATIDAFAIMGLDHDISENYDDIYSTKVRVDVEIGGSFADEPLYTKDTVSRAFDGYGDGRGWRIRYDERAAGLRYNLQLRGDSDEFIQIPNNIDETKSYHAFFIDHWDNADMLTREQQAQKRIVILMECTVTCNTAADVTPVAVVNAQPATVASLNAILGPWLNSTSDGGLNSGLNADTGVVPPTYFV